MSKPVNKTAVGAFVVVFAALLFACVVFFGRMSFGQRSSQYVIYLQDSVNGLDIGSAVKFKGVKVGSVKSVKLHLEGQRADDLSVPVIIEIEHSSGAADYDREKLLEAIRLGLRARLQVTSVVTGLLYVDLDFFPGTVAVFRGGPDIIDLPEIPTIPSNTTEMMNAVSTILKDVSSADFSGLSAQLRGTAKRLESGLAEIEFKKINDNVVRITDSAATILEDPELRLLAANVNALIREIDALSASVSGQAEPVAKEIRTSLFELRDTLSEIGATVSAFQTALSPNQGSLGQEFSDAIVQINDAARSVRALADYLQAHLSADGNARPASSK